MFELASLRVGSASLGVSHRALAAAESPFPFALPPPEDQLPPGFPNIDMGPQLKVVERTRTATMLCAASGNPDPEITWFKDFLPVDPSASNGRIKQLRSGKGRGWREQIGAAEGPEGEERGQRCCRLGNLGVLGFFTPRVVEFFPL